MNVPRPFYMRNPWHIDNVYGDVVALLVTMVVSWIIFIKCENMNWNKV